MIKKIFSRRAAELSVFFGLLCAVFMSQAHFEAACDDLRQNVLRLHIIANSDSEADQAVKLLVKDNILDDTYDTTAPADPTPPAGPTRPLIIRLGKAEGKNWWCVIFPAVCIPAAGEASLSDSTSDTSAQIAEHPQKYVMRFKTVEIYEDLKKFLNGK